MVDSPQDGWLLAIPWDMIACVVLRCTVPKHVRSVQNHFCNWFKKTDFINNISNSDFSSGFLGCLKNFRDIPVVVIGRPFSGGSTWKTRSFSTHTNRTRLPLKNERRRSGSDGLSWKKRLSTKQSPSCLAYIYIYWSMQPSIIGITMMPMMNNFLFNYCNHIIWWDGIFDIWYSLDLPPTQ